MYGCMKDYCLKCKKFCIHFDSTSPPTKLHGIYKGTVEGRCYCDSNNNDDLLGRYHYYINALFPNKREKRGKIQFNEGLLKRLRFTHTEADVTPVRLTYYFQKPTVDCDEGTILLMEDVEEYLEAKKEFFEKCDKYLRTTRCPLDNDDERCTFFVERMMKKWNQK